MPATSATAPAWGLVTVSYPPVKDSMALKRIQIPSPNYSPRNATVRLIVLHTAEGATSYQSLGAYFANPASGVSSHVGVDDTPNTVGEYVPRTEKAWTAANANPVAVQAELCAFADWTTAVWNTHSNMLSNLSQWIAEEAAYFSIPIVKLSPQSAQTDGRGVCQHRDLGGWGGGHHDCGDGFPIDDVITMAKGSPAPPPPDEEEPEMIIVRNTRGSCATFDGVKKLGVPDTASLKALQDAGVKLANIPDSYYASIPNA
jgi:hypothetical protein